MGEYFLDLDDQIKLTIKTRYKLLDVLNHQSYYSNNLDDLLKIYDMIQSKKAIYEVISIKNDKIKMREIMSYKGKLF